MALQWRHMRGVVFQITGNSTVHSTICSDDFEESIKAPHYCPFVRVIYHWSVQRAVMPRSFPCDICCLTCIPRNPTRFVRNQIRTRCHQGPVLPWSRVPDTPLGHQRPPKGHRTLYPRYPDGWPPRGPLKLSCRPPSGLEPNITVMSYWVPWRLKSLASPLFAQLLVQIKENIKAPRHWPLYRECTGDRWIPRTKHKRPVTWNMFPSDDVIMACTIWPINSRPIWLCFALL